MEFLPSSEMKFMKFWLFH